MVTPIVKALKPWSVTTSLKLISRKQTEKSRIEIANASWLSILLTIELLLILKNLPPTRVFYLRVSVNFLHSEDYWNNNWSLCSFLE